MNDYKGKTVVVTGGSLGIGAEFAWQLAARGATLVLVARDAGRLNELAKAIAGKHGGRVETIAVDLCLPGAAQQVFDRVTALGLEADLLVNNAGYGKHGAFAETSLETQRGMVTLNVTSLVELSHLFLPMLERKQGGLINVASTAAFQPVPYMAVYGATKAFVLSFSEALWSEYRQRGVRVLALCPGATDTPFFARAGEQAAVGTKASPADVVRLGLKHLEKGTPSVVHGAQNGLLSIIAQLMPRRLVVFTSERLMRPRKQLPA